MRTNAIDNFRGTAILLIVAIHCFGPWKISSFGEKVVANLIGNGTVLFVFISGFLFHRIFYAKFDYKQFIRKKIRKVFIPYFVLTSFWFIYFSTTSYDYPNIKILIGNQSETAFDFLHLGISYLWTGAIATPYWYIPYILITYLVSPLFIYYIRLPPKTRIIIFFAALIVSIFTHRAQLNINPIQSFAYYTSIYLFGINLSIEDERVSPFLANKKFALGGIVILLSIAQAVFPDQGIDSKAEFFQLNSNEINIFQKVFMCLFLLTYFRRHESVNFFLLKKFAITSFAIYFLHPWVLWALHASSVLKLIYFLPGAIYAFITMILTLALSLLTAATAKLILKKNSSYLIGW